MSSKADVGQGNLALIALKTPARAGSLHERGIARRSEETSAKLLSVNNGTLHPALWKLEQGGYICWGCGVSNSNRKAKYHQLTCVGRKQIEKEALEWEPMTATLTRFLNPKEGWA